MKHHHTSVLCIFPLGRFSLKGAVILLTPDIYIPPQVKVVVYARSLAVRQSGCIRFSSASFLSLMTPDICIPPQVKVVVYVLSLAVRQSGCASLYTESTVVPCTLLL